MKVWLTPAAAADLERIGDWIAERNPRRAVTFVAELRQRAEQLAQFPHAGPPRPQWGDGIRIVVLGKYLIVHRVRDQAIEILRIVHGARDLDTLFEDEPLDG